MSSPDKWIRLAERSLTSARLNMEHGPEQASSAYDDARQAAEAAAKALIAAKTRRPPPRNHNIGGVLAQQGLIPATLDERALSRFLAEHTRGAYDLFENVDEEEVRSAIPVAEALIAAAKDWPHGKFHPARRKP